MVETEFKYWAFISYSHADKKWGDWLHGALETYTVPKSLAGGQTTRGEPVPHRAFPVFRDREELPTSSDLSSVISRALLQSRYLVVVCSPRAAKSHWVNQEILDFKKLGREDRTLALIVDGEPNASEGKPGFSLDSECFPEALKHPLGADGNLDKGRRTEPIAADARPGKDGKANAALKLLAGILGLNYDDLKRRDELRRRRQQQILVSASAALVLIFATLAGTALWQWRQANVETKEANHQRQEAEKQKEEAIRQRQAAEIQKNIADEKSAEAETEKERVEAQTAADEEDLGREALLRGDQLAAAEHLSLAYEIQPQNQSVRLMLKAAMSDLEGLSRVLRGSAGKITRVEVAPVSGFILTVSIDGAVRVWDSKTGLPVATFGKSGNEFNHVRAASFSPDGKRVLFGNESEALIQDVATGRTVPLALQNQDMMHAGGLFSSDGQIVIGDTLSYDQDKFTTHLTTYNSRDGSQLSRTDIPDSYALVSAIGNGGRAILIGGPVNPGARNSVRKVLVVEVQTGKVVAEVPVGQNDQVLPNPQGNLIMVCHSSTDKPPVVYSAETGAQVAELRTKEIAPMRAFWTPSGRYVLSSGAVGSALWDSTTWKPLHAWQNVVWGAATVNQAESLVATVGATGEISVWDLHSGQLLKEFHDEICARESAGDWTSLPGELLFSPDGLRLIYAGGGECTTIWDWEQVHAAQPILSGHSATVRSIAFNRDESRAVTASDDNSAIIWNVKSKAAELTLKEQGSTPGAGMRLAEFSPDGSMVITGSTFEDAGLWDASNGSLLRRLKFDEHAEVIGDTIRAAVNAQGNRIFTFSTDGWGALWDMKTRKQIKTLQTENGAGVRAALFAADGSELLVADDKGFAHVFDSFRGELKRTVGRDGLPLITAEVSARHDRVLTADDNGRITIWSARDGHALQNINSTKGAPRANDVHFSPDGSMIIAACADNKVRVWNSFTGEPVLTVAEEVLPAEINMPAPFRPDIASGTAIEAGMLRARYSPDGLFFAGTNESGHILVWDAGTGRQLLRLKGHTGRVASLTFSPSGSLPGSSSEDNTARIWDVGREKRSPADIKRRIAKLGPWSAR